MAPASTTTAAVTGSRRAMRSARPLYESVYASLRDELAAGRFTPGSLLPSEAALCAAHGVSRITVRHALGLLKADGLVKGVPGCGWGVATPTATAAKPAVGEVLFIGRGDRVTGILGKAFRRAAAAAGGALRLAIAPEDPADPEFAAALLGGLAPGTTQGVILFSDLPLPAEIVALLQASALPVVQLCGPTGGPFATVRSDNYLAGFEMVERLAAQGMQDVGFVIAESLLAAPSFAERQRGYLDGVAKTGLRPAVFTSAYNSLSLPGVEDSFFHWFAQTKKGRDHVVVFCASNHVANQLVFAFARHGLRIPQDVSLCCVGLIEPDAALRSLGVQGVNYYEEDWAGMAEAAFALIAKGASIRPDASPHPFPLIYHDQGTVRSWASETRTS